MSIGSRIRSRRMQIGMTQEELAHKVGYTSRTTINKIELGRNNPNDDKIELIANVLNVTKSYLMWGESPLDPEMVKKIQSLDESDTKVLLMMIDSLLASDKYKGKKGLLNA